MFQNLVELAKQCPQVNITVTVGDLFDMVEYCIKGAKAEFEAKNIKEEYCKPKAVENMLKVTAPTLWRWKKAGYLCPVEVGGKRFYKQSDIDKILKREGTL